MTLAIAVRWIGTVVLGSVSIWLSVLNWIVLIRRFRSPRAPSWVPLVGGLAGAAAVLLVPGHTARFCWIPFVLDGGSVPGFSTVAAWALRHRRRGNGSSES